MAVVKLIIALKIRKAMKIEMSKSVVRTGLRHMFFHMSERSFMRPAPLR
jgi:hypothetical protein